jgi:hypothetical protein
VLAAIMGGAAQIVFLDRVPAHAAINHAVEWTKAMSHPGAAGLVNAVLRRIGGLVSPHGFDGVLKQNGDRIHPRAVVEQHKSFLQFGLPRHCSYNPLIHARRRDAMKVQAARARP